MKSTLVAYLLWFFLGVFGIHRFYLGRPISGVVQLLTFGLFGLWWLLDLILIPGIVVAENAKLQGMMTNKNTNTNVVNVTLAAPADGDAS